ncbi:TolB-like translocation protein [Aquimarina megaterium]|uniref:PD40 domain-containing protein n=1 Tax=Aquimarina megaterium TaxID=1443666 RepID=UPI000470CD84|nr:PD40 domain-containing protein [Aquimarina megaterium]
MSRRYYFLLMIAFVFVLQNCKPISSNNSYIDEKLPGITPELFAPSFVNTDAIEINTVFNASFTEMFFTRIIDGSFIIHHSDFVNGKWTAPQPIQMYTNQESESVAIDPSITQDGNTMYFLGVSPEDRLKKGKPDIYRSQKIEGKWQIASKVGYPVSTEKYVESYPVVVADGSIYFTSNRPGGLGKGDIYRAQYLGEGKFDTPVNIGSEVNSEEGQRGTYVSPDESYLITGNTYTDEKGFAISFKENNKWQAPVHFDIGEPLKKDWIYFCPYMSPDDKYFFFSKRYSNPPKSGWKGVTKGEVYWVDVSTVFKDQRK